jgi:hypothetical protein
MIVPPLGDRLDTRESSCFDSEIHENYDWIILGQAILFGSVRRTGYRQVWIQKLTECNRGRSQNCGLSRSFPISHPSVIGGRLSICPSFSLTCRLATVTTDIRSKRTNKKPLQLQDGIFRRTVRIKKGNWRMSSWPVEEWLFYELALPNSENIVPWNDRPFASSDHAANKDDSEGRWSETRV